MSCHIGSRPNLAYRKVTVDNYKQQGVHSIFLYVMCGAIYIGIDVCFHPSNYRYPRS